MRTNRHFDHLHAAREMVNLPRSASRRAIVSPMPLLVPVMTTILPSMPDISTSPAVDVRVLSTFVAPSWVPGVPRRQPGPTHPDKPCKRTATVVWQKMAVELFLGPGPSPARRSWQPARARRHR